MQVIGCLTLCHKSDMSYLYRSHRKTLKITLYFTLTFHHTNHNLAICFWSWQKWTWNQLWTINCKHCVQWHFFIQLGIGGSVSSASTVWNNSVPTISLNKTVQQIIQCKYNRTLCSLFFSPHCFISCFLFLYVYASNVLKWLMIMGWWS